MYTAIGRFCVRYRYFVLLFWLAATVAVVALFPTLSSVSQTQVSRFLPDSVPSIQAAGIASSLEKLGTASGLIVAGSDHGQLTSADEAAFDRVESRVRHLPGVVAVTDLGISADGAARQAQVETSVGSFGQGEPARVVVRAIRGVFRNVEAPEGLHIHLSGDLGSFVDQNFVSSSQQRNVELLAAVFIALLLLVVFRSLLAPLVTLFPAVLTLVMAEPIVAAIARRSGLIETDVTQLMLSVVVLGAGTDYGLFLSFRVREQLRDGAIAHDAVVNALGKVGRPMLYSALTVVVAFSVLLVAQFGLYRGLGPTLALAVALTLAVEITLLPALLAITGRVVFWPSLGRGSSSEQRGMRLVSSWVVTHPARTLAVGVVLLGGRGLIAVDLAPPGFAGAVGTGSTTTSDSAAGNRVLSAHFPTAESDWTDVVFVLPVPVWRYPEVLTQAQEGLQGSPEFTAVAGGLDADGTTLSPEALSTLHVALGPADRLPLTPPRLSGISVSEYEAYRASAHFISSSGNIVQFDTTLSAGGPTSDAAVRAVPAIRAAVNRLGAAIGAADSGVTGSAPTLYDVGQVSGSDLIRIIPLVLLALFILFAVQLRSLVAPLYLVASVALSYLASLGLVVLFFVIVGGAQTIFFVLPFIMFIFVMALGEDYNVFLMARIREELETETVERAVGVALVRTGAAVTSAGLLLAGTFGVLTVATTGSVRVIGAGVAIGVLLDTFVVRTLLVPAAVVLLGDRNWWPSHPENGHRQL
jgi:RND superfamily putative drug exporter